MLPIRRELLDVVVELMTLEALFNSLRVGEMPSEIEIHGDMRRILCGASYHDDVTTIRCICSNFEARPEEFVLPA